MNNRTVIAKLGEVGNKLCVEYIMDEHQKIVGDASNYPSKAAYQGKLNKMQTKFKALRKGTSRDNYQQNLDNFLDCLFTWPESKTCSPKAKAGLSTSPSGKIVFDEISTHKTVNKQLAKELSDTKTEKDNLQKTFEEAQIKTGKMRL